MCVDKRPPAISNACCLGVACGNRQESERASLYLDSSTRKLLIAKAEAHLLKPHTQVRVFGVGVGWYLCCCCLIMLLSAVPLTSPAVLFLFVGGAV